MEPDSTMGHDWYAILGVPADAAPAVIFAAYRRLARQHHPDYGGSHAQMVLLNNALEILRDPERRRKFDESRKATADAATKARYQETAAAAQAAAERYPTDWEGLQQFCEFMARDFEHTDYKSARFLWMPWPTAFNSLTGTGFIFGGGILGLIGAVQFFGKPPTSPGGTIQISPLLLMLGACLGAWAATFAHRLVGFLVKERRSAPAPNMHDDIRQSQVIECGSCRQKLRVPILESELQVTCGKCGHRFEHRSSVAPRAAAGPRELFVVSRETCAVMTLANAALFVPLLNCLVDGVFFSQNPTVWIGANVIGGILSCMSAAWRLGKNLVTLEIRQAESEEMKSELRPLRSTMGPETSGRVVILGAVAGLGGAILSLSLGPFWKFVIILTIAYFAGLFTYDKVTALVRRQCSGIRSSQATGR